jgi:membrane-associated protein
LELPRSFIDLVLHLDVTWCAWSRSTGGWIYAILFAIIFCETGFVVTPFLPGDSLLFVAGAIAATGA